MGRNSEIFVDPPSLAIFVDPPHEVHFYTPSKPSIIFVDPPLFDPPTRHWYEAASALALAS